MVGTETVGTETEFPPAPEVAVLMERVGARGHMTFGGRLAPDAHGMIASQMAKTHSGDWRNPEHIRAWTRELAGEPLPTAASFAALVAVLHVAIVGGLVLRDWSAFTRFAGNALPLSLIFLSTWLTGLAISTMPWSEALKLTPAAAGKPPPSRRS